MKLLLCRKCSDIRALIKGDWVTCRCGICKGRYRDDLAGEEWRRRNHAGSFRS